MVNVSAYQEIHSYLEEHSVTLVAVSKTKPVEDIRALYDLGQRDFGENYVQELVDKAVSADLPKDIRWHFIGHLQSNKVKYIAPFVHLVHGVDSYKLLLEIDKQAGKAGRMIDCLLQVHVAQEETKFGMDENELDAVLQQANSLQNIRIQGLMGMASLTDDQNKVRSEFAKLHDMFRKRNWPILSMGMSGDYKIAIEEGSTMVRVGSLLFGARDVN